LSPAIDEARELLVRPWKMRVRGMVWLCAIWLGPARAGAETRLVERVLARVDGRPILLSEIRERSRAPLTRLAAESPAMRAAAIRSVRQSVLERRIDEEIVNSLAARHAITISSAEIDAAVSRIAADNHVDVAALLADVRLAGWSDAEYRAELRRQLLEYRVIAAERGGKRALAVAKRRSCIERLVRF
jgi:peptidyl-prolyl cis-trans isomerase SurA